VVTSLTEDGPSDLAEELARGDALNLDENSPADEDNEDWEFWMPDPVDADPCTYAEFTIKTCTIYRNSTQIPT